MPHVTFWKNVHIRFEKKCEKITNFHNLTAKYAYRRNKYFHVVIHVYDLSFWRRPSDRGINVLYMLYQCYVLSLTDDLTFICTGFFIGSLTINLKLKQPTLIPYSVLPMVYRQVDKLGKEFYDCLCVRCQESKREKTQRTFNNFTKKYMIQILVVQHLVSRPH